MQIILLPIQKISFFSFISKVITFIIYILFWQLHWQTSEARSETLKKIAASIVFPLSFECKYFTEEHFDVSY